LQVSLPSQCRSDTALSELPVQTDANDVGVELDAVDKQQRRRREIDVKVFNLPVRCGMNMYSKPAPAVQPTSVLLCEVEPLAGSGAGTVPAAVA
jgi:hypothetical protein